MDRNFFSIVYDHWKIIFGVFSVIIVSWLKDGVRTVIKYSVPVWLVLLLTVLVIIFFNLNKRFKLKPRLFNDKKPKNILNDYGVKELYKVNWHVFLGFDKNFKDRKIWVGGPYCQKCDYVLDEEVNKWICVPCSKKYKIPYNIRICPKEKVVKIFEAKVRSSAKF